MAIQTLLTAILLGFIEGLTEFLPVSSTAHVLLAGHVLGFESTGKSFEVLIQLGAILAIVTVYFGRLTRIATTLPTNRDTQMFAAGILIAFLPAAILGALGYSIIKSVFFETPALYCTMLIIGGVALLLIDRMKFPTRFQDAWSYPTGMCLRIGLFQCLALVPGVSRSGATVAGALLMGADKRSALEFSFFLALPTMAGAFAYDLYKNRDILSFDDAFTIGVGFVTAFVTALIVVKTVLNFVARFGFSMFGWWRLVVGSAGLIWILTVG